MLDASMPMTAIGLRLQAVGDCNTEGADALPKGDSLPEKLKARLEQQRYAVTLQNLGYTMTTTREGVAKMELEAQPADVLLINFGLVDAWVTSIPQVYIPYYPDSRLRKFARKLLKSLKRRLRSPLARRLFPQGEVVGLEEYRRNLIRMIELARSKNPRVLAVLWSTPPTRSDQRRNANILRYNAVLHAVAHDYGALYIDAEEALAGIPGDRVYLDEVHLTGIGADRLAEHIHARITNRIQGH